MDVIKIYSPGHLSTIFQVCRSNGYLGRTGSRGAGITIETGIVTSVALQKSPEGNVVVMSNGTDRVNYSPNPTREVLVQFPLSLTNYRITIEHSTKLPFESGNGNSAAMVLNTAYGVYSLLLKSQGSFEPLLEKCHEIEVQLQTGLGDVGPMFYRGHGIELRTTPGMVGYARMTSIPYVEENLICFYLGKIRTKDILQGNLDTINDVAQREIEQLSADPFFDKFIECSRRFAKDSGLMPDELEKVLEKFDKASMIMLGNAGFIFGAEREYEMLLSLGVLPDQIILTRVTKQGTKIIE